jgi:hypothetical protein
MLSVYEGIIDLYAPYVLVRCARFTNDRRQGLIIGAYTLITTCLMAERLDHVGQLGISVDVVADTVGPDVVGGDGVDEGRSYDSGGLLIAEEWMQRLAEALNLLERPMREALVLHHVAGIAVENVARVLNRPAAEARTRIAQGEWRLARQLGVAGGREHANRAQVRAILARFAAELDMEWVREVRDCTIGFLARCHRQFHRQPRRWHLN